MVPFPETVPISVCQFKGSLHCIAPKLGLAEGPHGQLKRVRFTTEPAARGEQRLALLIMTQCFCDKQSPLPPRRLRGGEYAGPSFQMERGHPRQIKFAGR